MKNLKKWYYKFKMRELLLVCFVMMDSYIFDFVLFKIKRRLLVGSFDDYRSF